MPKASPRTSRRTTDAVEILHRRLYANRPSRLAALERARLESAIGRKVYELREECGLTQAQLARMVRTTPSVISRLEDADYTGHSLSMLRRIATVLDRRVEVRFVPIKGTRRSA